MDKTEIIQKHQEMVQKLKLWSDAYYQGQPVVSDAVFDLAFEKLQDFERVHSFLDLTGSPTQTVNDVAPESKEGYKQAQHQVPMLSLKSEVDTSDKPIIDFIERTFECVKKHGGFYSASPKFDGLSIELQYIGSSPMKAVTRGDGYTGEDVTHLVGKMAKGKIAKKVFSPRLGKDVSLLVKTEVIRGAFVTCCIRGEIVLPKSDFLYINKQLESKAEPPYSNPRNAAAGLLRRKEYVPDLHDRLVFYAYDVPWGEGKNYERLSKNEFSKYIFLEANGFVSPINFSILQEGKTDEELKEHYINFLKKSYKQYERKREQLDYDIDGVVYKVVSTQAREELGYAGREPRWAIAHKFVPEQATTVVKDIVVQVGKTGRLTPVALLEAVKCGGVEITNANLHHEELMRHIDIQPGDSVVVHRAGDVVPEVVCVDKKHPQNTTPQDYSAYFASCPSCGEQPTKRGMLWYCTNIAGCPGMLSSRLSTAVSRAYLNIEDLGPKTIDRLIETQDLVSVASIFKLSAEALRYAGVADSLIVNILEHIDKAKTLPLERIIASIGIPSLGVSTARTLLNSFSTLQEIASLDKAKITTIARFKEALGDKLLHGIEQAAYEFKELTQIDFKQAKAQAVCNHINVCVSGRLLELDKTSIEQLLLNKGFNVTSSVSSKLHYLVGSDESTSKHRKAVQLGIPIISSEKALQALLNEPKII